MLYVLRVLHILSGAFWYGALVFNARFLMPSLGAVGPAAGAVTAQLNKRGITQAFMGAAIVNVVSGVWMMFIVSGGDLGAWMRTGTGRTFSTGGTLAILAMIIGMIVMPPATKRLGTIGAAIAKRGGPPTPEETAEMTQLQGRMRSGTMIVAALLTLTVVAMALARYL